MGISYLCGKFTVTLDPKSNKYSGEEKIEIYNVHRVGEVYKLNLAALGEAV